MALDGEELPPVVAVLQANIRDLIAGLQEAKAMLAAFQRDAKAEAEIGADTGPAMTKMAGLEDAIAAFSEQHPEATLDVNVEPAITGIAEVDAMMNAFARKHSVTLGEVSAGLAAATMPKWASAVQGNLGWDYAVGRWRQMSGSQGGQFATNAQIAAMLAGLSDQQRSSLPSGALAAALGAGATGALAGGGGAGKKGGGLLGALGWGGGAFGMAGLGSLLGLMGFGAEHMIATGIGVGGSAVGGMLGGGLLGLGSLGVMGTGMATDMAGIGQAMNDAKQYSTAIDQLNMAQAQYNAAVAQYGRNSAAAATALTNLQAAQVNANAVLSQMPAAAQKAIAALVATKNQFATLFDKATGPAEAVGANILNQLMQTGETFLSSVGVFALRNMQIIQRGLQPLMAWLKNPQGGFGIFTDLETRFSSELPTAMHAFTQGLELVIKTIDVASGYTGGFIAWLDKFVTKWNGANFGKWVMEIGKLVGLFHTWWNFLKQVAITVFDIFKPAAGVGQSLIGILTKLLGQLDKWLTGAGKKTLTNLFGAHKKEIEAIGRALSAAMPTLLQVVKAFLQLETHGANLTVTLLTPLAKFMALISKSKVASTLIGWAGTLLLIGNRLKPLMSMGKINENMTPAQKASASVKGAFGKGLGLAAYGAIGGATIAQAAGIHGAGATALEVGGASLGFLSQLPTIIKNVSKLAAVQKIAAAATKVWAGAQKILDVVMDSNPIMLIIAGIALLGFAIYELVRHWKAVWGTIKKVAEDAYKGLDAAWHWVDRAARQTWGAIEKFFEGIWHKLTSVWDSVSRDVRRIWGDIVKFITGIPGKILHALGSLGNALENLAKSAWNSFWNGVKQVVRSIINFVRGIPHSILKGLGNLGTMLFNAGRQIITGLIHGIESMAGKVGGAIMHAIGGKGLSIGGVSLNPFHYLAAGGIVTRPTLAVVGEAGPEMVIPMNRLKGATISGGVSPLPTSMGRGGMGGQHLTVNVIGPTNSPQETAREVAWVARPFMAGLRAG